MKVVTEKIIQNDLFCYLRLRSSWPIYPNMDNITGYEADILAITKNGYSHEYEIKCSLADFRADMKKICKHASLSGKVKSIPYPYSYGGAPKQVWVMDSASGSYHEMMRYQCRPDLRPKNFWYVTHGFDVPIETVPEYAGLMKYLPEKQNYFDKFVVVRNAPNLPAQKVDAKRINRAERNMLFRYWGLRCSEPIDQEAKCTK